MTTGNGKPLKGSFDKDGNLIGSRRWKQSNLEALSQAANSIKRNRHIIETRLVVTSNRMAAITSAMQKVTSREQAAKLQQEAMRIAKSLARISNEVQ